MYSEKRDHKVDKVCEVWEVLYAKMYSAFSLAMPQFQKILEGST